MKNLMKGKNMLNNDVIFRALRLYKNSVKNSYKSKTKEQLETFKHMNIGIYTFLSFLMPLLSKLDEYDLSNDKFENLNSKELEKILELTLD